MRMYGTIVAFTATSSAVEIVTGFTNSKLTNIRKTFMSLLSILTSQLHLTIAGFQTYVNQITQSI